MKGRHFSFEDLVIRMEGALIVEDGLEAVMSLHLIGIPMNKFFRKTSKVDNSVSLWMIDNSGSDCFWMLFFTGFAEAKVFDRVLDFRVDGSLHLFESLTS